jgi:hypothetical protein
MTHQVRCSAPGYKEKTIDVTLPRPGEDFGVTSVDLLPLNSTIAFENNLPGFQVRIGSVIGTSGKKLSLAPFITHEVRCSAPGYAMKSMNVTLSRPDADFGVTSVELLPTAISVWLDEVKASFSGGRQWLWNDY